MDGILNIHKATGMTSHDVVAKVRKTLKQKRVGHAGTLDPAASGVLPVCVGQGTRVAEYLSESGKAYQAQIIFGIVTDTYDAEGQVLRTADTSYLTQEKIADALQHFLGPQQQLPPLYSAIKIQGQPAYKRMRAGEDIHLEARPVVISHLELLAWKSPQLTLAVECSKGTYIRSLAYDLGEYLGCGAHLGGLIRTRSGPFTLADSITLEQLADAAASQTVEQYLFPADKAIEQYPALMLTEESAARVLHGNPFRWSDLSPEQINTLSPETDTLTLARVYTPDGRFLAIASWNKEQNLWQPKKVFVE